MLADARSRLVIARDRLLAHAVSPPAGTRLVLASFSMRRDRLTYLALALATIAVGLAVHLAGRPLHPVARDLAGDALWAVMIVWWVGAAAPSSRPAARAGVSLAICFAVEIGQLYHAPAIDAVRATTAGHLVLGSGFDPRDLAAYAAGVIAAVLFERASLRLPAAPRRSGEEPRTRPG